MWADTSIFNLSTRHKASPCLSPINTLFLGARDYLKKMYKMFETKPRVVLLRAKAVAMQLKSRPTSSSQSIRTELTSVTPPMLSNACYCRNSRCDSFLRLMFHRYPVRPIRTKQPVRKRPYFEVEEHTKNISILFFSPLPAGEYNRPPQSRPACMNAARTATPCKATAANRLAVVNWLSSQPLHVTRSVLP